MLPLAVPGLVLAFGYIGISLQLQVWLKVASAARPVQRAGEPGGAAGDRLRDAAIAVRRAQRRRGSGANAARPGTGGEKPRRSAPLTLRQITLPLISANLIAGGLLAFAFAMLEVSDSLILAQPRDTGRSPRRSTNCSSAWATARTSPAPLACGRWCC